VRAAEVPRRRIRNSGLVGSSFETSVDVVRWHGAVQAQDWGPAKWSIAQRAAGVTDADIDAALAEGSIVRTHVLRPTWHVVAREDLRWLLALTGPIVQRWSVRRQRELNLDAKQLAKCERVIAKALEERGRLTRPQLGERLARARLDPAGQRLPYLLMHCELEAMICSAGLDGKQHTYGLVDDRVPPARQPFDREAAVMELISRYLASHGPAAAQDLRWWSSLSVTDIRRGLASLGDEVRSETLDGVELWATAREPSRAPAARGVFLLPPFDELIVGYQRSRYLGDPKAVEAHAAWKDRSLRNGVLVADGRILGLWGRTIEPPSVLVEVQAFEELGSDSKRVEAAGRRLGRFMRHPVTIETSLLHHRG
jgi:DNA glycosylase AlkZ-like